MTTVLLDPTVEPATTLERPGRLARQARLHVRSALLLLPLLAFVGWVHALGAARAPGFSDDEGTYMAQAWAVQTRHALSHYTYWYDHPPFGWIQIAGWTWLTGAFDGHQSAVSSGRAFMVVVAVVSGALLYVLARRLHLSRGWSALAVVVWGLSPLAVSYTRMVFLDNVAVPWVLAAFVLAASPRRNLWAYTASGCCLAAAVLSKETFLLMLPALVVLLWERSDPKTRAFCLTGFGCGLVLLVAAYPLFALLKGELLPGRHHVSLLEAAWFQLGGRASTGSALDPQSFSAGLVRSWLDADPWILVGGSACALVCLLGRHLRAVGVAVLVLVASALRPGYLPQPFVIAVLPFAALAVAGTLQRLAERTRWTAVVAVVAAVGVAGPAWASGDRSLATRDDNRAVAEATAWVALHVPHTARLLVDDDVYVDLVRRGFDRRLQVIWFYKLGLENNLDPSVQKALPGGWRDCDYLILTPVMRGALASAPGGLPGVAAAVSHSTLVARLGSGPGQVEVRRIHGRSP